MASDADPTAAAPTKTVRCPSCGGPSVFAPSNAYRPFCCARCKQHDFGAWASESFKLPAEGPQNDADLDLN